MAKSKSSCRPNNRAPRPIIAPEKHVRWSRAGTNRSPDRSPITVTRFEPGPSSSMLLTKCVLAESMASAYIFWYWTSSPPSNWYSLICFPHWEPRLVNLSKTQLRNETEKSSHQIFVIAVRHSSYELRRRIEKELSFTWTFCLLASRAKEIRKIHRMRDIYQRYNRRSKIGGSSDQWKSGKGFPIYCQSAIAGYQDGLWYVEPFEKKNCVNLSCSLLSIGWKRAHVIVVMRLLGQLRQSSKLQRQGSHFSQTHATNFLSSRVSV